VILGSILVWLMFADTSNKEYPQGRFGELVCTAIFFVGITWLIAKGIQACRRKN
jgi:hypothetical protein